MQKAKIIVAVRKRPLFEKEKSKGFTDIITVNNGYQVIVSQKKQKVDLTKYIEESVFNFDYAFGQHSSNEEIYGNIISPLIDSAFEGAKVSCFAYGQTGSGKTYTMNGVINKNIPGLYTLAAFQIFERLLQSQYSHLTAQLSFYEIYCTKVYDLLNKRQELVLREDKKGCINVVGLSEVPVACVDEFQNCLKVGSAQRVTSQNSANSQSSRSHAILQITLKQGKKVFSKVSFIDLAGNERGADHMNMKKQTQKDGQEINKSLLALKECIRDLDQGKTHVGFRGSKLTMCLKDSFIGFCRTVMIGNISPSSSSAENTLNTLRYADRVKQLKSSGQISRDELKSRQMMLPRGNNNIKIEISNSDDEDDIAEKKRKALNQYAVKEERTPSSARGDLNLGRRSSMGVSSSLRQNQGVKGISTNKNQNVPQNKQNLPLRAVEAKKTIATKEQDQKQIPEHLSRHATHTVQRTNYQAEPMEVEKPLKERSLDTRPGLQEFKGSSSNIRSHYASEKPSVENGSSIYTQNYPQNPSFKANNFFSNGPSRNVPQHRNGEETNQMPRVNGENNKSRGYSNPNQSIQNSSKIANNFFGTQNQYREGAERERPMNPQRWNDIVEAVKTTGDAKLRSQLRQKLNSNLFQEENSLINEHSGTLQNEIQKIKEEMEVIKVIEHDRNQLSSRDYARLIYDSVDDKISQLQQLKEKVATFMYKLDDMDEIEQHCEARKEAEDQQLLDDFC